MGVAKIVGKKAVDWIKKNRQSIKKEVYSPEGKKKTQDLTKKLQKGLKRAKHNIGGRAGYATGSRVNDKRKPKFGEQPARKRKEEPVMILQTSVPEGPAKRFKTPKTFEIFKDQIDGTKIKLKKDGGRAKHNIGGRANLLEEMGRLDAERMNPNRRAEKHRVIGELNKGYKHGKRVKKQHGGSAQAHYVQHGYGPHKSSGKVLKGKKVGIQIK